MSVRSSVHAARHLRPRDIPELPAIARTIKTVMPNTIVGREHLLLLNRFARAVERDQVPGAIVECGVFRGASAGAMAAATREKAVWLFDSFEGLPPGGPEDNPAAVATRCGTQKSAIEDVTGLLERLHVDPARMHIQPGWFSDTLADAPVDAVALLHVDADWYESTKEALDRFLPNLSPGGYLVVDDYQGEKFAGCRKAVDETLGPERQRHLRMITTGSGAWLRV